MSIVRSFILLVELYSSAIYRLDQTRLEAARNKPLRSSASARRLSSPVRVPMTAPEKIIVLLGPLRLRHACYDTLVFQQLLKL